MDIQDLEQLGIKREDIVERIIQAAADRLLGVAVGDEDYDADEETLRSRHAQSIRQRLQDSIRVRVDRTVNAIADREILPRVNEKIEALTIQRTNTWGERTKDEPLKFIEYLILLAEKYMLEPVDFNGRTEAECRARNDSWHGTRTSPSRLQYAMDKYFQAYMAEAMKQVLANGSNTTAKAITDAVLGASKDALAKIQVQVVTK